MRNLLDVTDLSKLYFLKRGFFTREAVCVKAVDGVTFNVEKSKVFGLVGESGSGKSTIARLILCLEKPTSGTIMFNGEDIVNAPKKEVMEYRTQVGAVFQDPFDSLNPMMNVYALVSEPLDVAGVKASKPVKGKMVNEALRDVKLMPHEEFISKYPHELSGGQRQRVSLARALILRPRLVIADEPLSMLDVSLRADMLNLMEDMRERYKLTMLFITHDLAVARYFCDDIAVIYRGRLMEKGPSDEIFRKPRHPYTLALREAVPEIGKSIEYFDIGFKNIPAEEGCHYRQRCSYTDEQCAEMPEMIEMSPRHFTACFKTL